MPEENWGRYAVQVDLCITIRGESEETRRNKLRTALEAICDGLDLEDHIFDPLTEPEARIYGYPEMLNEEEVEVLDGSIQ